FLRFRQTSQFRFLLESGVQLVRRLYDMTAKRLHNASINGQKVSFFCQFGRFEIDTRCMKFLRVLDRNVVLQIAKSMRLAGAYFAVKHNELRKPDLIRAT